MDTQGVSRDEAMASGLVPVTNAVAAVPEFVDTACGYPVEAEDYFGLAASLSAIQSHGEKFQLMSDRAQRSVRNKSEKSLTISLELEFIALKKK
jgi:glycosyltransferase involved in cell wall biosynthesis